MQYNTMLIQEDSSRMLDRHLQALLKKTCKTLKNPNYHPDAESYQNIANLIQNTEFFRKKLETTAKLKDFIHQARHHFKYEVHDYGTVIMKEKEYADKFYIILDGHTQKLHQRPAHEIEQELLSISVKLQSFRKKDYEVEEQPQSTFIKKDTNKSLRRTFTTKRTSPNLKPITTNFDSPATKHDLDQSPYSIKLDTENCETEPDTKPMSIRPIIKPFSMKDIIPVSTRVTSFLNIIDETPLVNSSEFSPTLPVKKAKIVKARTTVLFDDERRNVDFGLEEIKEDKNIYESQTLTKEQIDFVRQVAMENPDLDDRLFSDEVVRVNIAKTFYPGECFGENFCKPRQPKENSIIAVSSRQVHLLTISREGYIKILSDLSDWMNQKAEIFQNILPKFNEDIVREFSYSFCRKRYIKGETIFSQDDQNNDLYLVHSGEIRLYKEADSNPYSTVFSPINGSLVSPKSVRKVDMPLVSVTNGQFFGEEALLKQTQRQYTAVVNSTDAVVLILEGSLHQEISEKYSDLFKAITNQAHERFSWRQQRLTVLMGKQQQQQQHSRLHGSVGPFFAESPRMTSIGSPTQSLVFQNDILSPKSRGLVSTLDFDNFTSNSTRAFIRRSVSNVDEDMLLANTQSPKSSDLYKMKFSRKLQTLSKLDLDEKSPIKTEGDPFRTTDAYVRRDLVEFNIRKELESSKDEKGKLPKLFKKSATLAVKKTPEANYSKSTKNSQIMTSADLCGSPTASPIEKGSPRKDPAREQSPDAKVNKIHTFPIFGSKKDMIKMKSVSLTRSEFCAVTKPKNKKKLAVEKLLSSLNYNSIQSTMKV